MKIIYSNLRHLTLHNTFIYIYIYVTCRTIFSCWTRITFYAITWCWSATSRATNKSRRAFRWISYWLESNCITVTTWWTLLAVASCFQATLAREVAGWTWNRYVCAIKTVITRNTLIIHKWECYIGCNTVLFRRGSLRSSHAIIPRITRSRWLWYTRLTTIFSRCAWQAWTNAHCTKFWPIGA